VSACADIRRQTARAPARENLRRIRQADTALFGGIRRSDACAIIVRAMLADVAPDVALHLSDGVRYAFLEHLGRRLVPGRAAIPHAGQALESPPAAGSPESAISTVVGGWPTANSIANPNAASLESTLMRGSLMRLHSTSQRPSSRPRRRMCSGSSEPSVRSRDASASFRQVATAGSVLVPRPKICQCAGSADVGLPLTARPWSTA
jgi:hypothetical protein